MELIAYELLYQYLNPYFKIKLQKDKFESYYLPKM